MHQEDSIASQEHSIIAPEITDTVKVTKPQHPYQVLRSLPKDATPAQQDSAIQSVFQPKQIRYSERPDTLHLPGYGIGKSYKDVNLPQYYKESFFSKDSMLHSELRGGRYGVAGDPVPYTVRNDNTISSLLIICFVLAVVSFSNSRRFIFRQVKELFFIPTSERSFVSETSTELRFQCFMVLLTSLLLAILQYFYAQHYIATTFILPSQYHLIAVYFGMLVAYFLVRGLLYTMVNLVFFSSRKNLQWMKSLLFITSVEGVLLFPVVMLQAYFDLSMQTVSIYVLTIFVLVKLLTFYKCYLIFFRRIGFFLQIILYFCALEVVPIVAFWGALVITGNYLKINF